MTAPRSLPPLRRFNTKLTSRLLTTSLALAAGLSLGACAKKVEAPKDQPVEVGVVTIATQAIPVTSELRGRTRAFQIAEVRPQVNGIIQKRLFQEGADVKAGSALYQIDAALYQAAYDSAKGTLARAEASALQAKTKADRYQTLVAIKAVSQQDFDDASAQLKQANADVLIAKASVQNARINLAYTHVNAPISGRIGASSVTAGALVNANQSDAMTSIQQLDPIYVDIPQSSNDLMQLRQALSNGKLKRTGDGKIKVQLVLDDGSVYTHQGTLEFSDITVNPNTSSINLRTLFPNPEHELLPGLFVRAVLQEGTDEHAILVPQQGVTRNNKGEPTALIVVNGHVEQRVLSVSRSVGDQWQVSTGLNVGDQLIVDGLQKAKPGKPAKAVPSKATNAISAALPATLPASGTKPVSKP